jgi:hypothetical protein
MDAEIASPIGLARYLGGWHTHPGSTPRSTRADAGHDQGQPVLAIRDNVAALLNPLVAASALSSVFGCRTPAAARFAST